MDAQRRPRKPLACWPPCIWLIGRGSSATFLWEDPSWHCWPGSSMLAWVLRTAWGKPGALGSRLHKLRRQVPWSRLLLRLNSKSWQLALASVRYRWFLESFGIISSRPLGSWCRGQGFGGRGYSCNPATPASPCGIKTAPIAAYSRPRRRSTTSNDLNVIASRCVVYSGPIVPGDELKPSVYLLHVCLWVCTVCWTCTCTFLACTTSTHAV